jgi:hypothetical protein
MFYPPTIPSDVDELLLYQPSASVSQVVMTTRIQDDSGRVPPASVTHAEAKLGLEARIIPNHEREYPDVMSMALPQFVEPTLREYLSRVSRKRVGQGSMSEGELVGSIEIPCIEEVVVDVWRTDGWTWATTTVSDVKVSHDIHSPPPPPPPHTHLHPPLHTHPPTSVSCA